MADGSGPPELVVLGDGPPAASELAYTLRVHVRTSERVVPANVATAVEVPSLAERIEIVPTNQSANTTVRAWSPADDYLGASQSDGVLSIPASTPGSYVVLPNASSVVRIVDGEEDALAAEAALEAVGWREQTGQVQILRPSDSQRWTVDLEQPWKPTCSSGPPGRAGPG